MDVDERALKVITDWDSKEYENAGQEEAALLTLIIAALKEQDNLTRYACVHRVALISNTPDHDAILGKAIREIVNTKAA